MTTIRTNRELAEELYHDPGNQRLIVFAYAPVDINAVPEDTTVVPMHIVPLDWRHVIDCQIVIACDGRHMGQPIKAAEMCLRFMPWELLMWNVVNGQWLCIKDGAGKYLKRCPGVW